MEGSRPAADVVNALLDRTAAILRPGLTAEELAGLRRRLLVKGRELAEQLAALMAGLTPKATDLLEARPGETPIERTRRYLDLVDGRIKAITAGRYGTCSGCHAPIPYVRLAEVPWMDLCTSCAAPA
jgi:RNA polymerase-binding transcription factor DksA